MDMFAIVCGCREAGRENKSENYNTTDIFKMFLSLTVILNPDYFGSVTGGGWGSPGIQPLQVFSLQNYPARSDLQKQTTVIFEVFVDECLINLFHDRLAEKKTGRSSIQGFLVPVNIIAIPTNARLIQYPVSA